MDKITSNISKATGLGLTSIVKNYNEIDPIVLKLENVNVKMVLPIPNEMHCFIIVEQEHFQKKQSTRTVLSRAHFGSDEVEKIGEFIGDLQAIYPCPNSSKVLGFIYDASQNRTKVFALDHKSEACKRKQKPYEYKIPLQGRVSDQGARRISWHDSHFMIQAQVDPQAFKFYHLDLEQEIVEYCDDSQTIMFVKLHIHECLIRVYLDGSVQFDGQSFDKEPLKVTFRPFEDEARITMIETDQLEKNLIFLSDMNVVRVFEVKRLLRSNLTSDNMIYTEFADHREPIQ